MDQLTSTFLASITCYQNYSLFRVMKKNLLEHVRALHNLKVIIFESNISNIEKFSRLKNTFNPFL